MSKMQDRVGQLMTKVKFGELGRIHARDASLGGKNGL